MAAAQFELSKPVDDEALIERIEAGDQDAFTILYERYLPRVLGFVRRRLSNRADAEETVQEVFINIFSSLHTYRREAPFEAWVLGLTRRTIARRFKKKQHPTVPLQAEDTDDVDPMIPTVHREPSPLEHYEYRERVISIESRARRELSAEQRELFERHHLRNEPVREIARVLSKSEDAVKSNLYRVRKLLFAR
jgi:RNA polymerase sigma-70 factor (ECF subfamily)